MRYPKNLASPSANRRAVGPASKSLIDERLTKLRERKDELLSLLQDAYERGPKARPFDADISWAEIVILETVHTGMQRLLNEMSATEQKKRYQEIADILKRARRMIYDAMRSTQLARGLIDAWWQLTTGCAEAGVRFVEVENEFEKVRQGLAILEQAAARAFGEIFGRPLGDRGDLHPFTFIRWRTCIEVVLDRNRARAMDPSHDS
jgi:hypothetical protein